MAHQLTLLHPEEHAPAVAIRQADWRNEQGQAIGSLLRFPDGPRYLTFVEILALQQELRDYYEHERKNNNE